MVVGSVSRGCQVAVIGGGPGGYVAALRLARLGKDVILVEREATLGGVCLNEGCIPSKALIHVADLAHEARAAAAMGLEVDGLRVDLARAVGWKDGVVRRLTAGLATLCAKSGVEVLRGEASFASDRSLQVASEDGVLGVQLEQAVIATGSQPSALPGFEVDGETVIGSREALSLGRVPERLVVLGGGYVGLELGSVYAWLGSRVVVVEVLPALLPALDAEVGEALRRRLGRLGVEVLLGHRALRRDGAAVVVAGPDGAERRLEADKVLVTVGRAPRTAGLGLEAIGVARDERGFVRVDRQLRTSVPGIWAVGDSVGGAMLAHKAYQEAKVAAEVIAGAPEELDVTAIPAVVYTDPEVAWVGLSERAARERGHEVVTGSFPLSASGRALTLGAADGFVKAVAEASSGRLLGVVAVGRGVSELMGEATLALEMGAFLEDVGRTVHPHPTLSEALQEAVEAALGRGVHTLPG